MTAKQDLFTKIARKHLSIETLEPRNRDSLDFHEVGVVGLRQALQDAYDAGRADAGYGSESLIAALRENLSPEAVAAIASWLQPASISDENVSREVRWFAEQLAQALGGWDQQNRLAEDLGL